MSSDYKQGYKDRALFALLIIALHPDLEAEFALYLAASGQT
jgi:hypothetical protein